MTEEAANEPAPKPVAKIVTPKEREASVPLDWPVEWDGHLYEAIRIRRVTGLEVETFVREIQVRDENAPFPKAPMIDCPVEVFEALDDDDRLRVEEAMGPFMPRRLLQVIGSIQAESENTPEK